jgi:uncharacterized protein involved in response to NO
MSDTDGTPGQSITPIGRMPFRPFFLAATAFSCLAIPLWVAQLQFGLQLGAVGLNWHVHEMIMGFAATVILGFVLTAAQTWTGLRTVQGTPLLLMLGLWLLARLCWLLPPPAQWIGAAADATLFGTAAVIMGSLVVRSKNWRNAFFVPVFLVFGLFSGAHALAVMQDDYGLARSVQNLAFYLIVHVILVVGGRVIPFFSDRRLQRPDTIRYRWLELGALLCSLAFMLVIAANLDNTALRIAAALVAAFNFLRWLSWKPWQSKGIPLLWSLYLAYAFIISGFIATSLGLTNSASVHLIAVGGIGLMILAMISRVSLGHAGRPLAIPSGFSLAYVALLIAALSRALASLAPEYYLELLWLAAAGWVSGFGLFLYHYLPILVTARIDGGPG